MAKNNLSKKEVIKPGILKRIRSKLSRKRIIFLTIILLVIGFGYYFIFVRRGEEVETAEVQKGPIDEVLILSGQVSADEHVQLAFPTAGKVGWVGIKEGDTVYKNQALSSLNKTSLNSSLEQAQSTLRYAEAALASVYDSVQGHATDETYAQRATRTQAEVTKDNAYEALKVAEYNIANSTLYSPFEGIVSFVGKPLGVNISPSEPQVEVVNPKTIFFSVSADQSEIADLSMNQKVKIVLDTFSDKEIEGVVTYLGLTPISGEVGAVYEVKVAINPNEINGIRIGMTGDAKFILSQKSDVLYVPSNFVNTNGTGKYVNLGRPKNKVYVVTGIEGEEFTEVTGSLQEGDIVYD